MTRKYEITGGSGKMTNILTNDMQAIELLHDKIDEVASIHSGIELEPAAHAIVILRHAAEYLERTRFGL